MAPPRSTGSHHTPYLNSSQRIRELQDQLKSERWRHEDVQRELERANEDLQDEVDRLREELQALKEEFGGVGAVRKDGLVAAENIQQADGDDVMETDEDVLNHADDEAAPTVGDEIPPHNNNDEGATENGLDSKNQPEGSQGPTLEPDRRSREELLNDTMLMQTLHTGTFAGGSVIPPHFHLTEYPGKDWVDRATRPSEAVDLHGRMGAWKCPNTHAYGDYYNAEERDNCAGCGQRPDRTRAVRMRWTLPYVLRKPGTGYVLLRDSTVSQEFDIRRRKTKALKQGSGPPNAVAATIWEVLHFQYPALTAGDLQPYWSRPMNFLRHGAAQATRFVDAIREQEKQLAEKRVVEKQLATGRGG